MELWQIVVALLQGLAEWLPISSEGQVFFFVTNFTAVPLDEALTLAVWLHLGTALAVVARYPRIMFDIISLKDRALVRLLFIATVATAVTAIPLYIFLKQSINVFQGEVLNALVGVLLLLTALALYLPTRQGKGSGSVDVKTPTDREALLTGLVQGTSVLPGLSRSGVTVSALLMQKVDRETALRFSFLMSVPAVVGILGLEILTGNTIPTSIGLFDLVIVEVIVFVVGLASIELLLRLARRINFWKLCLVLACIAIAFGIPALFNVI